MNLFRNVHESWIPLLHSLAYKEPLVNFLTSLNEISYQPDYEKIFKVFEMPVKDIRLVILGQDPYPKPGDAIGTAFAVSEKSKMPEVLKNIRKEALQSKEWVAANTDWQNLKHWTNQGVFLLNSALTVETGNAGSHLKYWKQFTETVVSYISAENPCVWMLWGKSAMSYSTKIKNPLIVEGYDKISIEDIPIDPTLNYIIPGEHPAVMSMGKESFSNNGFYYTNKILEKRSLKKIIW